jgi:GNAT superfamily N-acetyltransferase
VRPLGGIVIEDKKEYLFIYNVVVAPERQHQGVGRALLRFAEEGGPADRHGALLQGIPHCAVQLKCGIVQGRRRPWQMSAHYRMGGKCERAEPLC